MREVSKWRVGCRPTGQGSPLGPGFRGSGRGRSLQLEGEGLQLPRAGRGGPPCPPCMCTFDVVQAVGQGKPELPSVDRSINATQSSMGPQKMWVHGPVAGLAGNQGAAFQQEMKGSLYPDSYQCTHTPFSPLWEGFSVWGAGSETSTFSSIPSLH